MNRRAFIKSASFVTAITSARTLLATTGAAKSPIGICTFSCHQHWRAVDSKHPNVKFTDSVGFYRYARELGADGVQTPLRGTDPKLIRGLLERSGGFYEAEFRLPKSDADLPAFESEVRQSRAAGTTIARAVFTGGRRYETLHTRAEFETFHQLAKKTLERIEPILRKHKVKVALENHKDHTAQELASLLNSIASEWIGALVDTGNNLALLEAPEETISILAPFVFSVHLKDMAMQPIQDGFRLSEVPLGTGFLDLPRLVDILRKANPSVALNLEMATRDPLRVPCLTDHFFATFPDRKASHLAAAMERVKQSSSKTALPSVAGKTTDQILAEEEMHNRDSLVWMRQHFVI